MVSAFQGIEHASAGGGSSRNFEPGHYVVRLVGLKVVDSKKRKGTKYAIVECSVVSFEAGVRPQEDSSLPPVPVSPTLFMKGDEVAWKVNLAMESALDNMKAFALAVLKQVTLESGQDASTVQERDITPEVMDTLFAPNGSPAIGIEIRAEAFNIFTRSGNPFTKMKWSTLPVEGR